MGQAYLISKYGRKECSECGVSYSMKEWFEIYYPLLIKGLHINCKNCGAEYAETPKRCYWSNHYPGESNACGEQYWIDGICYCYRQFTFRKKELISWGCYYSCECYKQKNEEYKQLSFFEE